VWSRVVLFGVRIYRCIYCGALVTFIKIAVFTLGLLLWYFIFALIFVIPLSLCLLLCYGDGLNLLVDTFVGYSAMLYC